MITDVVDEWWPTHALKPELSLPGGVFNKYGPDSEEIETPTDFRMLWYLENVLALGPQTEALKDAHSLLLAYLQGNCKHHWRGYGAEEGYFGAHLQCLWGNDVVWLEEKAS